MATLQNVATGSSLPLAAQHLVGRAPVCHLRINEPNVSGVHAELVWSGGSWTIRDRGSRNGTFVNGRRLAMGERVALIPGTEVSFGNSGHRYRLADDLPPRLMALSPIGEPRLAEHDLLRLPCDGGREVTIFQDASGRWNIESDDGTHEIDDQEFVVADGRSWRICLPSLRDDTQEQQEKLPPRIEEISLTFVVSLDEEHIEVRVEHGSLVRTLDSRAHAALLLALARLRMDDAARPDLASAEQGWVHREDLLRMLAIDPELLNLWVYRARRQLSSTGIRGAAKIIERRVGTLQMRLGVQRIRILPP